VLGLVLAVGEVAGGGVEVPGDNIPAYSVLWLLDTVRWREFG
jgi:hypothetical protein